jgi:hypothetical protein
MLSGNALVLDVQSTTARSNVSWIEPHANSGILEFGIAAAEILRFNLVRGGAPARGADDS